MKKILLKTLVGLVLVVMSTSALAQLTPKAIFHRCYRQLTQTFPAANNPLSVQVAAGTLDPVAACMQILDKARLTANGNKRIADTSDEEAMSVIKTMQSLHHSWFTNKTFPLGGLGFLNESRDLMDYNGPALYFTRALLTPSYTFSDVFKGNTLQLESDRMNNSPTVGPVNGTTKAKMPFKNNTVFASKGKLRGVRTFSQKRMVYTPDEKNGVQGPNITVRFDHHWGGGVLGSHAYVALNADVGANYRSDGAVKTHRKWSRNVFKDFLCRSLPVVRYVDAESSIDTSSNISFRQAGACTTCHVAMDPLAATIRNAAGESRHRNSGSKIIETYTKQTTSQGSAEIYPTQADSNFYRRPTEGTFYFRTHNGELINKPLSGVEAFGAEITNIDAPYICAAKRYYRYFTGINANVDDIADPQYAFTLSEKEISHRNEVIALGRSLKTHQSLRTLIEDILKKPQFKNSGYNLSN